MNPAKYSSDRRVSEPVTAFVFAFITGVFAAPANAAENINGQVTRRRSPDRQLDSNALGCERRCAEAVRADAYWCGWSLRG